MQQNEMRAMLRLVGVAFFIFFFGFLLLSSPFWWKQWQVLHTWPAVDAEVLQSDVSPITLRGKTGYDIFLVLRFKTGDRVLDTTYRSNKIGSSPDAKRAEVARFPVGKRVQILYDPSDPTKVRLDPGYNLRFFAVPAVITGMGLVCALAATMLFLVAGRVRRAQA